MLYETPLSVKSYEHGDGARLETTVTNLTKWNI
jgi:hypothetical protein